MWAYLYALIPNDSTDICDFLLPKARDQYFALFTDSHEVIQRVDQCVISILKNLQNFSFDVKRRVGCDSSEHQTLRHLRSSASMGRSKENNPDRRAKYAMPALGEQPRA